MAKELSIIDQLKFTKGSLVEQKVNKVSNSDLWDIISTEISDKILERRKIIVLKTIDVLNFLRNKLETTYKEHSEKKYSIANNSTSDDIDKAMEIKELTSKGYQLVSSIKKQRDLIDKKLNEAYEKMTKDTWQQLEDLVKDFKLNEKE